jgi:hypothetical protein
MACNRDSFTLLFTFILNVFGKIVNYITRAEKSLSCKFVVLANDKVPSSGLSENRLFAFLDLHVRYITSGL